MSTTTGLPPLPPTPSSSSLGSLVPTGTINPGADYSWYNVTSSYNGTGVEGGQSLNFNDFLFQQIVANNIAVAALTLYAWEYISSFADEIRLYRSHKIYSRHVILFLLVRYATLPALILPAYSVWHDFTNDAQGCLLHQQLAICVVQLIVSIVFAWRTIAIWGHQRKIVILFIVIVCLQFGASFGLLWFSEEVLLPNGSCMPVTPKDGFDPFPAFYVIAFAYDIFTMCFSSFRLWRLSLLGRLPESNKKTHWTDPSNSARQTYKRVKQNMRGISESPLIERLVNAGLIYFLVASSFNAIAFGLEVANNVHSKALITLYAPLMCVLCQRIILLDVKAIWGELDKSKGNNNDSRAEVLIDRVLKNRRLSWQGSEDDSVLPQQQSSSSSGASPSAIEEKSAQHIVVDIDEEDRSVGRRSRGLLGLQDMLNEDASAISSTSPQSLSPSDANFSPSRLEHSGSHTLSQQDGATAVRMAGLDS